MSFGQQAVTLNFAPDHKGRVRECCGNCQDWLADEYYVVIAHLASGNQIEVHICEACRQELEREAEEYAIPLEVQEAEVADLQPGDDPR